MHNPIISISGIRGVLGESLTPENIVKFTTAFARYVKSKRVVIGRDGRLHGDIIEKLIESTLLLNGCEVINLGMAPTPTVTLAVETLKAQGGISITASHNPQQWNGMKFINGKGVFLDVDENREFLSIIESSETGLVPFGKVKQIEYYPDFINYHIKRVLKIDHVNKKRIRKRKFKVVADCINSSGSVIVPALLEKLGCRVIKTNCDSSGIFARNPEPLPENITKTCHAVRKNNADIGVVVDTDADRLVIISEKGIPFGEENTITTVINRILKAVPKQKRIAVVNLSTSRSVDDVVNMHGGKLFKSPVGEINVIKKMIEVKAVVGGEGSGGVILPELHFCRDSLIGIALILSEIAEFGRKVSEYANQLPKYFIKKAKVELKNDLAAEKVFEFLKNKFRNYAQNQDDGLRVDFENSWVNFRRSNTEPIVRIIAEGKSDLESEKLLNSVLNHVIGFQ